MYDSKIKESSLNFDLKRYEFCSDFSIFIINESLQENGEQSSNITPKEYKVHRYVLSQQSEYFKVLFESSRNFIEHKENAVMIRLKDPFNVFPQVLRYMYTGYISINHKTLISILSISDRFAIEKLTIHATTYFDNFYDYKRKIPLNLSFISAQEIYTLYLEAIENEFEEVIPDWLLAIAFDELWEIDNDVMSSIRLDRVLKCDCVKLKNEDQKFSVIRKIVADFCGSEEYDETFEEKWNKMALRFAMPFPDILDESSEESSEESTVTEAQQTGNTINEISDETEKQAEDDNSNSTLYSHQINEIIENDINEEEHLEFTFHDIKEAYERLNHNNKLYEWFKLVNYSLLDPKNWEVALADNLIPNKLVLQGLFEVLKKDDTEIENFESPITISSILNSSTFKPTSTIEYTDCLHFTTKPYYSDIKICINHECHEFHKIILSIQSVYFCDYFSTSQGQLLKEWIFPWQNLHPHLSNGLLNMIKLLYYNHTFPLDPNNIIPILFASLETNTQSIISLCMKWISENKPFILELGCGISDPWLAKSRHQSMIRKKVISLVSENFEDFEDYLNNNYNITKDLILDILNNPSLNCNERSKIYLFSCVLDKWFPNAKKSDLSSVESNEQELSEIRTLIIKYINHKKLNVSDLEFLSKQWWMPKDLFHSWMIELAQEKKRRK
ncbi:BTB/POZ domain-containing protein 17 [Gigaspora margarita]|uniref:BTB/POZ domain-containing protein 17 n=1 Tax=Gigaspora margarita TaxID=4874 RepID=A0A8H3X7F1_GIGMA|nr:BTB/POZ domain-containing protein 17 [Gigaspora margarita]